MFACDLDPDGLSDADNIVTQKKQMSNYVQEFTDDGNLVIPAANTDILKSIQDKQAFVRAFFLYNYSKSFNILLEISSLTFYRHFGRKGCAQTFSLGRLIQQKRHVYRSQDPSRWI